MMHGNMAWIYVVIYSSILPYGPIYERLSQLTLKMWTYMYGMCPCTVKYERKSQLTPEMWTYIRWHMEMCTHIEGGILADRLKLEQLWEADPNIVACHHMHWHVWQHIPEVVAFSYLFVMNFYSDKKNFLDLKYYGLFLNLGG